uniref:CUB domain-containing protein n=3 Tax=Lotharella globosa TaxID=91324 RepID=A0A7S3YQM6_9EUKA|mmetsp:Transcript_27757/g.54028  ORF Transcript_27757/g.54028 Transcript_27757/m.54028 type:complete len:733 (+) Transcript_27757:49-2247(+)|eukprot:CAMPEP_0167774906 /NCGR_PEP_ID=MMETSP0111_2-20121227/2259_1 /TAXON_ID=91324 /ORGANISM="Lotharella globosa, Strain CCCM811" /LENGTH=732 /DNA_ID=CAMNT_0007664753 /DNA_START=49 /DNA_END=2247 /DNA_ORIENTATION=+
MPLASSPKCPVLAAAAFVVAFHIIPQCGGSPVHRPTASPTGKASIESCEHGYYKSRDGLVIASAVAGNKKYYHNVSCWFVVEASEIIFNYVDIYSGDMLYVYDGYDPELEPETADFLLTSLQLPSPIADPAPIISKSGHFSFWWTTDEEAAGNGWKFTIREGMDTTRGPALIPSNAQGLTTPSSMPTISPSSTASGTPAITPGQTCFKSHAEASAQRYTSAADSDGLYFNDVSCRFVVEASMIQFQLFDVEWQHDYLEIFLGDDEDVSAGLAERHKLTGALFPLPIAKPKSIISKSGYITMVWHTDGQVSRRGWNFVALTASTLSPTFRQFENASTAQPSTVPTNLVFPLSATSRLLNTELPSLPDSSPIGFPFFYHHLTCDEADNAIYCAPLHSETMTKIFPQTETATNIAVGIADGEDQNPKYATCGSVQGNMILCAPYSVQHALYIDTTGGSTLVQTMSDRSYTETEKYVACSAIGRKLYCAPYRASGVLVIDGETRTSRKLTDITYTSEYKYYYESCAPLRSKIYCAPFDSQFVLVIDSATDTSEQWTSINYGRSLSKYSTCRALDTGSRTKIFCAPYHADNVLVIDPDDPAGKTSYALKQTMLAGDSKFSSCAVSGAKLFCAPEGANQVLLVDASTESSRLIGSSFEGSHKHYVGRSCVAKSSFVYCAPWDANYVLEIDVSQESMVLLTDAEYANPNQWGQCNLDPTGNNRIFCAPARPNSILVIDL